MSTKPPASMRELIDAARDHHQGVGVLALARISKAAGRPVKSISHGALSRFYSGKYKPEGLERATIETLAYLANVSYEVARNAVYAPVSLPSFTDQIPTAFDALTPPERQVLLDMGYRLLEARAKSGTNMGAEIVEPSLNGTVGVDLRGLTPEDVTVIQGTDLPESETR